MAEPITIEDIYKLFQRSQAEADRRFAEADRRAAEADRRAAESKAEFDRRMAEADQRAAEADRRAAESKAEFDRRMAEADQRAAESRAEFDKRFAKTEAIAAQANHAVNALSSRWGKFVENLVAPAAIDLFQARGIAVQEIHLAMKAKRSAINLEIDIFAVDDTVAVAIEVKSRLTQAGINQFIQNLGNFKQAFPAYKDYDIYGAVAGIEIDRNVDRYAYKQGLFVIKQSGETVKIDNDANFRPNRW